MAEDGVTAGAVGSALLALALVAGTVIAVGVAVYEAGQPPEAELSASFDADSGGVSVEHVGGEALRVADLRIVVERGRDRARIDDIPAASDSLEGHVAGDPIVDTSAGAAAGPITSAEPDADGRWSEGDVVRFRLADPVDAGDRLTVRVVHAPTDGVLYGATVEAG